VSCSAKPAAGGSGNANGVVHGFPDFTTDWHADRIYWKFKPTHRMNVNLSPCQNEMKEGTSAAVRQGDAAGQVAVARSGAVAGRGAATAVVVERRRTPRRRVDAAVVLRLADAVNPGPIAARLVDLSAGGVGVRLPRPLAPGKLFTLDVPGMISAGTAYTGGSTGNGERIAFALRYRVVRCTPLGHGSFHVGAAFVRTPAPPVARASAAGAAAAASAGAARANAKRA
jgi:hypothetical protein